MQNNSLPNGHSNRLILVIENNAHHAQLIEAVLRENTGQDEIMVVQAGTAALNYLRQKGDSHHKTPDLILLDFDLPGDESHTVLTSIKADSSLKRIPIIVLTHSSNDEDILKSYKLHGNCYVIKSADLNQLAEIMQRIKQFWLGIVTLPSN